jgi:hypothetical protein
MKRIEARHTSGVLFVSANGLPEHFEHWSSFGHNDEKVREIIKVSSSSEAYLWTSNVNPLRQVWKIEINRIDVLPFNTALRDYRTETEFGPAFMSCLALLMLILFFFSMIKINRSASLQGRI